MEFDIRRGIDVTCPVCGKGFYITDPDLWVFKLMASVNVGEQKSFYFDKYTCKRAYEKEYEKEKKQRRIAAAKKGSKTKKEKARGKLCTMN